MQPSTVLSQMKQQLNIVNSIDELVKYCKDNNLESGLSYDDMTSLTNHLANLSKVCNAAVKLGECVQRAENAKKDETKKKATKKVETEEDDLDFLD